MSPRYSLNLRPLSKNLDPVAFQLRVIIVIEIVNDDDLIPSRNQFFGQVRTNEPRPAGDEYFHDF